MKILKPKYWFNRAKRRKYIEGIQAEYDAERLKLGDIRETEMNADSLHDKISEASGLMRELADEFESKKEQAYAKYEASIKPLQEIYHAEFLAIDADYRARKKEIELQSQYNQLSALWSKRLKSNIDAQTVANNELEQIYNKRIAKELYIWKF